MSCKLLGFQPEAKFKLIEHTNTGTVNHYFADFWDAQIFSGLSKYKCEILELE
jgi:hypothetical protein